MLEKKSTRRDRVTTKFWLMLHLYLKDEIKAKSSSFDPDGIRRKHQNVLLPGYTHLQIAMPSSL
jgi:argininosuccinate lyase